MLPEVPQGSTLRPVLFNIFSNDLCVRIYFTGFLLFVDDLKIFRMMKSTEGCKLIQSGRDSVHKQCNENCFGN
jgi:hypothetical protein